MHILLLGASGRNGALVLETCLERGHTITALARKPSAIHVPTKQKNLTVLEGSPTRQPDLERAFHSGTSFDAVILALGHRRSGNSPFAAPAPDSPHNLMESTVRALLGTFEALRLQRIPKLVVNSAAGVGASWDSLFMPIRLIFTHSKAMRLGLEDHATVDELVRKSGAVFVLARAGRLSEGPAAKVCVWPDDGKGMPWLSAITRASLAEWLVDAVESSEFDGRAPVLTN